MEALTGMFNAQSSMEALTGMFYAKCSLKVAVPIEHGTFKIEH